MAGDMANGGKIKAYTGQKAVRRPILYQNLEISLDKTAKSG
jgi:hypothetical protein